MDIFKKKEWLMKILRKFKHPVLRSQPKEIKYGEFLNNWSKNFSYIIPIFIGLLAPIFINILTKDIIVPPQELFSYLLTSAFTLIVLTSLLISLIVAGILYVIIVLIFGSLIYLLQRAVNNIQVKLGSAFILILIVLLVGLGYYITRITTMITWPWMIGLLIESIGVIIALHIFSHYLNLFDKSKK